MTVAVKKSLKNCNAVEKCLRPSRVFVPSSTGPVGLAGWKGYTAGVVSSSSYDFHLEQILVIIKVSVRLSFILVEHRTSTSLRNYNPPSKCTQKISEFPFCSIEN